MTFTFAAKSTKTSTNFQDDRAKISTKEINQIEYVDKLNIGSIKERGVDDLTGASYVMDKPNSWMTAAKCEFVSEMASWTFGTIAGGVAGIFTSGTLSVAVGVLVKNAVKDSAGSILGGACLKSAGQEKGLKDMVAEAVVDTVAGEDRDDNDGNGNNNDGNGNGDGGNGDGGNGDGGNGDGDNNGNKEPDSAPEEQQQEQEQEKETDQEKPEGDGVDDSNPNEFDPYQSDGPNTPRRPPGDVGGKHGNIFNPGEERGFTPGDDGGDGNPGNPWDRNERMSTPNDNGDPVDPLTGLGGPSGPQVDDGNPIDPDEDFDSFGPGNDLWKPNPDDVGGGGPNSSVVGSIQIEDEKSMAIFVDAMSADLAIF